MSTYQVANIRRIRTDAGVVMVAHHNSRTQAYNADGTVREDYPHAITHPENRIHNEYHCDPDEILKARLDRIEAAKVHRKPQKNAARAFEITFSASPDWFKDKSVAEAKELFIAARGYLAKRFGAEQIIGWSAHFDETTPHMHVVLVPLVNNPKHGWKYASGEFVGGRAGLYTFHDELAQALKPFGVERGERGKGAEHTDLQGWKRDLERREKAVARQEKELAQAREELDRREQTLGRRGAELDERARQIDAMWAEHEKVKRQEELMWVQRRQELFQSIANHNKRVHDFESYVTIELKALEVKKAAGKGKGRDAGEELGR